MSSIKIETTVTFQDLLKGVDQLEINDLEKFVKKVLQLRAKKIAPSLSKTETELLKVINQPIPILLQNRFTILNEKRVVETLNNSEHQELINITTKYEALNVKRLKALGTLAKLRKIPVRKLMKQLGIQLKAA